MVLTEWVRHALPLKLKDGKRHLFPTLASMVYKPDEANPDEFIPIVDENGKLVVDDAAKLAGKDASHYENIITSITANGAVVEPDEHGNVNLGNMQTGSSVELDDTLKVEGKAADAKATGDAIDQLSQQMANYRTAENLLGNSGFVKPVNQRGYKKWTSEAGTDTADTKYNFAGGYTIDRWKLDRGTLVVNNGNITIDSLGNESDFDQNLEIFDRLHGKTITIAGKTSEGLFCQSFVMGDLGSGCSLISGKLNLFSIPQRHVVLRITNGAIITFEWIALYEGSYTIETLPPYRQKDYAVELAECQRYLPVVIITEEDEFKSIGVGAAVSESEIKVVIPVPTSPRKTPIISCEGMSSLLLRGGSFLVPTAVSVDISSMNAVTITCTVSDAVVGAAYELIATPGVKLMLLSEL